MQLHKIVILFILVTKHVDIFCFYKIRNVNGDVEQIKRKA